MSLIGLGMKMMNLVSTIDKTQYKDVVAQVNTERADEKSDEYNTLGADGFGAKENLTKEETFDENGNFTGFTYKDAQGQLAESVTIDPATGTRTSQSHYEYGQLTTSTTFESGTGKKTGEWTIDPETGSLIISKNYEDGVLVSTADAAQDELNELGAEYNSTKNAVSNQVKSGMMFKLSEE